MSYMDSGLKKITSIHDTLDIEMNWCLLETNIVEWRTKRKTTRIHKKSQNETATIPVNRLIRKCTERYKLQKSKEKINHLMYIDDIKLFAKNEKELETIMQAMRIYIQHIRMEFGIEKCAMLILRWRQMTEGKELPNQEKIGRREEKETYKYFGWLEADNIKHPEKEKKEYLRRTRKLLETKVHSRNLIKRINTWAVPLVRYSGPFFKWTREELQQMDLCTRKLVTTHKAFHPRDDIDRLYASRIGGGRGLASFQNNIVTSIQRQLDYRKKTDISLQKQYRQHKHPHNK